MWQEIVIIIIGVVVFGYVGYKIYCFITKSVSPCDSCIGCALKEQLKGNGDTCDEFKKKK